MNFGLIDLDDNIGSFYNIAASCFVEMVIQIFGVFIFFPVFPFYIIGRAVFNRYFFMFDIFVGCTIFFLKLPRIYVIFLIGIRRIVFQKIVQFFTGSKNIMGPGQSFIPPKAGGFIEFIQIFYTRAGYCGQSLGTSSAMDKKSRNTGCPIYKIRPGASYGPYFFHFFIIVEYGQVSRNTSFNLGFKHDIRFIYSVCRPGVFVVIYHDRHRSV